MLSKITSNLWPFAFLENVFGTNFAQAIAVLNYMFHFAGFPVVGAIVFFYILFSRFWFLAALYLAWYIYDARTPQEGGRLWEWCRQWRAWRLLVDFFPITLHKEADLPADKNYILAYHPHGITVFGGFANFGVCATGFKRLFPGLESRLMVIEIYFKFPFYRDYILYAGLCNVHKESYRRLLTKPGGGNAAVVVPGGAEEALDCCPDKMTIILQPRKGFIKMALRTGASLVPVIAFGENETYRQVENPRGSFLRRMQVNVMNLINFSPPLFYGQLGIFPHQKPINTIVGAPIHVEQIDEPSWESVCELHERYVTNLRELFEKYKVQFGYSPEYQLEIL